MNIYDAITRTFPYAFYKFLTSATSYTSSMGNNSTATVAAANLLTNSLVSGPSKALSVTSTSTLTIPFPERFSREFDDMPFSLQGWFYLEQALAVQLMGHTGATDGLYFNGDYIKFSVDLEGGGSVTCQWAVPDLMKTYFAVGVYAGNKISLYIDGVSVAEAAIPDGSYLATKANKSLFSSAAAGRSFQIEAPAVHYDALTKEEVAYLYNAGRQNVPAVNAAGAYGGVVYQFADAQRDVMLIKDVNFDVDGQALNLVTEPYLAPVYGASDGLSEAGTFTMSVPIAETQSATPVLPQGMKLNWNGDGNFTVQYSLNDGATWTTAVNDAVQANTVNIARTVTPQIKVTFASGRAADLDVLRSLRITIYSSNVLRAVNGTERTMLATGTPRTSSVWSEPIEADTAAGTVISVGNKWTINESTDVDKTNVGSIELRWTPQGTVLNSTYLIDSRSVTPSNASFIWIDATGKLAWSGFSAVYINGVATTSGTLTPVIGRSYHILAVYTTPHNAKIDMAVTLANAPRLYNHVGLYEAQLTAAQAARLYGLYQNPITATVTDLNAIVITEPASGALAYVYAWARTGAG